jgi:hypothetical protein
MPLTFTFRMDGSSMQFDKLPNDGQPKPESGVPARRGPIRLSEAIEYMGEKLRTDAFT